jgi:hypothetical protein
MSDKQNIINKYCFWKLKSKIKFYLSLKIKIMVYKFRAILDAEEDMT